MTNITVNFQPFLRNQMIYAYKDGNIVEDVSVPIEEISSAVTNLSKKYNANEINLIGNQDYLARFKAEMGTKFTEGVNINIIGR